MSQRYAEGMQPSNDNERSRQEAESADADKLASLASEVMGQDETPIESQGQEPVDPSGGYEEEIARLKDQLIRAVAETENVRKRAQRDLDEANKYAVSNFARHLVSVLENLQRATASIDDELRAQNPQVKNLAEGVEMTQRELLGVFDKFGIRRIDPKGEKFDHNLHQAMTQMEDDTVPPGTVLQVLQAGYTIHDRLLQPALVNVSKRGEAPQQVDTEA